MSNSFDWSVPDTKQPTEAGPSQVCSAGNSERRRFTVPFRSAGFQQHLCSLWEGETESSWKKKKKKAKKHYVLGPPDFWLLKMGMQPF